MLFASIFCWNFRYFVSGVRNIYSRSHVTYVYIYNQCTFLLVLMVYMALKTTVFRLDINIEKMCICARAFDILKLLFLPIFCWYFRVCRYKLHACRHTYTDKFPNVPTKLICGGNCPPPPPPGYASGVMCPYTVLFFVCFL